jgi:hypothetical protein
MTVEITRESEDLVTRMLQSGKFLNASEAINEALKCFEAIGLDSFPYKSEVGYPPGSLLHLYTDEENEREARLVRSHEKKLEAF